MLRTPPENNYYHAVCVVKITKYFNDSHKKFYFVKVWTPKVTHEWIKKYHFGGRSTTVIESEEWEEIMKGIREAFSGKVYIPTPGEDDNIPDYN